MHVLDINECGNGPNSCHKNSKCINTPGSYVCRCIQGFFGDGHTCKGIFFSTFPFGRTQSVRTKR